MVTLGNSSVQNTAKNCLYPITNSFAELSISDVDIVGSSGVGATPIDGFVVSKSNKDDV